MAKQNDNRPTSKLWVKVTCGVLGLLMVAGVVFMFVQLVLN